MLLRILREEGISFRWTVMYWSGMPRKTLFTKHRNVAGAFVRPNDIPRYS